MKGDHLFTMYRYRPYYDCPNVFSGYIGNIENESTPTRVCRKINSIDRVGRRRREGGRIKI